MGLLGAACIVVILLLVLGGSKSGNGKGPPIVLLGGGLARLPLERAGSSGQPLWLRYGGADAPGGGFIGWLRPGTTSVSTNVPLPRTLEPGVYRVFLKSISYKGGVKVGLSAGGGSATLSGDGLAYSGLWSSGAEVHVQNATRQLRLTLQRTAAAAATEKLLLSGIYITPSPHSVVLGSDTAVDLTPPPQRDNSAPRPGNLAQDGSFETGIGSGWGLSSNRRVSLASVWDPSTGHVGHASVRLPLDPSAVGPGSPSIALESRFYSVQPNKRYTLSAWVRSDSGSSARGSLALVNSLAASARLPAGTGYKPPRLVKPFQVGSTWTRVSVSGYLLQYPTANYQIQIKGLTGAGGHLWIDGVSLTEGSAPPAHYVPAAPLEVGLIGEAPANVYYSDEPARMQLRAANETSAQRRGIVHYQVYDWLNRLVAQGTRSVVVPANSTAVSDLDLSKVGRTGSFRVVLWVAGESNSQSEFAYGVVPRPQHPGNDPSSSIGIHSNFLPFQYAALGRLGIHWDRALSPGALFRWSLVEPKPGQFVWNDGKVANARAAGISILGTLGVQAPAWAQSGGVPNLDAWQKYVSAVASHYRGRVQAWEIWNEPNARFTSAFYAQMLARASQAIRAADPSAQVVGIGGAATSVYVRAVMSALATDLPNWRSDIDALSIHMYPSLPTVPAACDVKAKQFAPLESAYGLPIWNSETGVWDNGFLQTADAPYAPTGTSLNPASTGEQFGDASTTSVATIGQNFLQSIGNGMSKWFYYDSRLEASPSFLSPHPTIWEYDDTIRPKGIALAVLAHLFDHSQGLGPLSLTAPGAQGFMFNRGGTPLVGLYTCDNSQKSITLPGLGSTQMRAFDTMGDPVPVSGSKITFGPFPVYVEGHGISVDQMRAAFDQGTVTRAPDVLPPSVTIDVAPLGPVPSSPPIELRWSGVDSVSIVSTATPDAVTYSYRVVGPGQTARWSGWSPVETLELADLKAGTYTFEVRGRDASGNVSAPVTQTFQVTDG